MSERVTERTDRADFQATSDPGLLESADRGEVNLLSYEQLYNLWERQQWATQDIDFSQDRIDWHERIPEEERFQRMYGLSSFFIGEQRVAEELGPMMRAAPTKRGGSSNRTTSRTVSPRRARTSTRSSTCCSTSCSRARWTASHATRA